MTTFLINTGVFPLEQAICMFYFKQIQDPLQLVNSLDALTIISHTQFKKEEFLDNTNQEQYSQLTLDQKEFFQTLFNRNGS